MNFSDIKQGMIFRNNQPPPYLWIIKKEEKRLFSIGLDSDGWDVEQVTHYEWEDYFEDIEEMDPAQVTGSLLHTFIKTIFEHEVRNINGWEDWKP